MARRRTFRRAKRADQFRQRQGKGQRLLQLRRKRALRTRVPEAAQAQRQRKRQRGRQALLRLRKDGTHIQKLPQPSQRQRKRKVAKARTSEAKHRGRQLATAAQWHQVIVRPRRETQGPSGPGGVRKTVKDGPAKSRRV